MDPFFMSSCYTDVDAACLNYDHVAGQRRSGRQEHLRLRARARRAHARTHTHTLTHMCLSRLQHKAGDCTIRTPKGSAGSSVGRAGANYGRRLPKTCLHARPLDGAPICRPDFGDTQSRMRRQSVKKGPNTPGEFDWCHKTHCVM